MQLDQTTEKIINLLAQQESVVSRLYRGYSFIFPNSKFWSELSDQENVHMQWIMSLKGSKETFINKDRFNISALESMIEYLNEVIGNQSKQTLKQALGIALDIENSLIEKSFFTVFDTDSVSLKNVLQNLSQDTDGHRLKVKEELDKI